MRHKLHQLSSDEIAEIEQKLDDSLLDEETSSIIKQLIARRKLFLDLFEELIQATGHQRTKVLQKIEKIFKMDLDEKNL